MICKLEVTCSLIRTLSVNQYLPIYLIQSLVNKYHLKSRNLFLYIPKNPLYLRLVTFDRIVLSYKLDGRPPANDSSRFQFKNNDFVILTMNHTIAFVVSETHQSLPQ